jgi:hypothetical protein
MERLLQCRECRGWYGEVFFARIGSGKNSGLKTCRCIGCRLTRRTRAKNEGQRFIVKARNAIKTHSERFLKSGIIASATELADRFGWKHDRMAHDIEHAVKNGCPYCCRPFAEMANGLADVTLDIVDPAQSPYYATNTRWCCMTCNRAKSKTDPNLWSEKLRWWDEWRKRREVMEADPMFDTLFEGVGIQGVLTFT